MHSLLERVFAPLFRYLEKGTEPHHYRPSHRTILKAVSALFFGLSVGLLALGVNTGQVAVLIPLAVFSTLSVTTWAVATLGSDRAVGRIWSNR